MISVSTEKEARQGAAAYKKQENEFHLSVYGTKTPIKISKPTACKEGWCIILKDAGMQSFLNFETLKASKWR